jgi:hypothetical protein
MALVTGHQSGQRRLLAGEGADGVMLESFRSATPAVVVYKRQKLVS